jgi:bifunctional DNase/RNase
VIEVVVAGLGVVPPGSMPMLLLREREGTRALLIGIGPLEAQAIALPLQGVRPPRPMTHDVFAATIARLGAHVQRVEITGLLEGTFHARLALEQGGQEDAIDIRPSDAVALAVRTEVPIYVAETVLDEAGVETEPPDEASAGAAAQEPENEVDASKLGPFKEFIETLDIDDLDAGGPERRA